jgi:O-glycosyl hydrolase
LRGRLITIAVLAVLAAVAAVSTAVAGHHHVKHYATNISIKTNQQKGTIQGVVTSPNEKCSAKRKVFLYQDGKPVFHIKANADGEYGIVHGSQQNPQPLDDGKYQVKAERLTLSPKKVCDPGQSKVSKVKTL